MFLEYIKLFEVLSERFFVLPSNVHLTFSWFCIRKIELMFNFSNLHFIFILKHRDFTFKRPVACFKQQVICKNQLIDFPKNNRLIAFNILNNFGLSAYRKETLWMLQVVVSGKYSLYCY